MEVSNRSQGVNAVFFQAYRAYKLYKLELHNSESCSLIVYLKSVDTYTLTYDFVGT